MVCIALKVLDWYNPYTIYTVYFCISYAIQEAFSGRNRHEDRRKRTQGVAGHRRYTAQSVIGREVNGKHRV